LFEKQSDRKQSVLKILKAFSPKKQKGGSVNIVLAVIISTVMVAFSVPATANDTIKVGLVNPMTGGGSFFGDMIVKGIRLSAEEINKRGGLIGQKVELIVEDDRGLPAEGVAAAQKLINKDNVVAILGAFNSPVALAIADLARRYKVPQLTTSAVAPEITEKNAAGEPWVFRAHEQATVSSEALSRYLFDVAKIKSLAIIYENTDSGKSREEMVAKMAKQKGVPVVATEVYNHGDMDFYSSLTRIKKSNPEAIFLSGIVMEGSQILKQGKELGLKAQFVGSSGLNSDKLIELAGPGAEGFVTIGSFEPTSKKPIRVTFTNNFKAKYGVLPDNYAARGHDAMSVLADAVRRANSINRSKVREALAKTKDFQRIEAGPLTFNEKGDVIGFKNSYLTIKNGKRDYLIEN
jgi:branched-chain amino acid transport system substrate-binding protein